MALRPTSDGTSTPKTPPAGTQDLDEAPARHRHVWVSPVDGDAPHPGLVHLWRRGPLGWTARVTFLVEQDPEPVMVTQWLPAEAIRPA